MKHVKIFGLAVLVGVASVLMVDPGSGSATVLCKEYVSPCPEGKVLKSGTAIDMELKNGASVTLSDNSEFINDTCTTSTMAGKTTTDGGSTATVKGTVSELTFHNCSNTTVVLADGSFEIHYVGPNTKGELTSAGAKITVTSFASCVYETSSAGTDLGIIESDESVSAEFKIEAKLPSGGGFLCPSSVTMKGEYRFSAPATIYFKKEEA